MPINEVYFPQGELTIDTSEKSTININSTSYNVYDNWFIFIQKYFGVDDTNDPYISLLKSSFFGYFNEIASSEIKNAVYHKTFLYDEHFLNTAVLPESIYNFAKLYNVPIESAIPSSMYISIAIREAQILGSYLLNELDVSNDLTNGNVRITKVYTITLDRSFTFSINNFNFLLPYPIIINIQEFTDGTHSFSAMFDTSKNHFPPLENISNDSSYIKVWREKIDGNNYVFLGLRVYQLETKTTSFQMTNSTTSLETLYNNINYNDQLCYLEGKYKYAGEEYPLNLYYNNIYTPSEEEYYGYYTYQDTGKLQVYFSNNENAFRPVTGSTIEVTTYTTKGAEGNFDYTGVITMSLGNNDTFQDVAMQVSCVSSGSSGGENELDTFGKKTKILEAITTRNNLITDNDLEKYFDSINESINVNGSTIKFVKKQDDVLKRIWCNFILLRDENKRIVPTNTAPKLIIPKSELTNGNVIKEHSIVTCNYVRDIPNDYDEASKEIKNLDKYIDKDNCERLDQNYIKYDLNNEYFSSFIDEFENEYGVEITDLNSIYEKLKLLQVKPDLLVYTIPFMIRISEEPFLNANYFNMDINKNYKVDYSYINSNIGSSFSISNITIEKDVTPSADNKYTLESNVYNISMNLNSNVDLDTLKEVIIKCNVYSKDFENKYGFFIFNLESTESSSDNGITNYSYKYTAKLATNYKFRANKMCLFNSLYGLNSEGNSVIKEEVYVDEDLEFKIGIMMYNKDLALKEAKSLGTERYEFREPLPISYYENIESDLNDITLSYSSFKTIDPETPFDNFFIEDGQYLEILSYSVLHDIMKINFSYNPATLLPNLSDIYINSQLNLITYFNDNSYSIIYNIDMNTLSTNNGSSEGKEYIIDRVNNIITMKIDLKNTNAVSSIRSIILEDNNYVYGSTDYKNTFLFNEILQSINSFSKNSYYVVKTMRINGNLIDLSNTMNTKFIPETSTSIASVNELQTFQSTDKYNIDNYCLATTLTNSENIKLYQNLSKLMNSIVNYDSETDSYIIELVPLVGLRYFMSRSDLIFDLVNRFINIIDENLPRLENNTTCDLKFYNTYGPSRYFYLQKEIIESTVYTDNDSNIVDESEFDNLDYSSLNIVNDTYTRYNYLGRTDIILDFTIYLYENITEEKDKEIKKFISDFVENANEELVLPISNLISLLESNFPIIKFIKYNGIFSDILDNNISSKNNDYQIINNDFDFNKMSKEEIIAYTPECLNLKKDIVSISEDVVGTISEDDILTMFEYSDYDYVITIKYKI